MHYLGFFLVFLGLEPRRRRREGHRELRGRSLRAAAGDRCSGKIYNDDGSDVPLTVTQAGTFEINGGPPRGKKIPVKQK